MTAKFVEMEILVNNLKGINVEIVDLRYNAVH